MNATDRLEEIEVRIERQQHGFRDDGRGDCAVCGAGVEDHSPPRSATRDTAYLLSLVRTQAAEIERLKAVLEAARTSVQAVREYGHEIRGEDWSGLDGRDIRDKLLRETEPVLAALASLEEQT